MIMDGTYFTMPFLFMVVAIVSSGCLIIPRSTSTQPLLVVRLPSRGLWNKLDTSKLLIEEGANLFMKKDGVRAIDIQVYNRPSIVLGPQVLQHALDLHWSSVKHLLLLSKSYSFADRHNFQISMNDDVETFLSRSRSARLAASVFAITGLVRHIAEYLIRTKLIVRDPATKKKDQEEKEPDDVKRRTEATLAAAREESNKRGRKK
jgi:hypothetical protein